jgi:polysaccharide export outer membrane protein
MVSRSRFRSFTLGVGLLGLLAGCATDEIKGTNPVIPTAATTAQLRPGDSLTIALQGVPDPSTNNVQIDDQGLITLPFIGPQPAAGISPADLSTRVRETYLAKKIYTAVDVSVSVTERYVYVGGEVGKPGRIVWTPDLTVTKAVQAAGGFSLYAKEGKLTLVRDQRAYELNARLAQQNPAQDPRLMPGDSLQVPRSAF